MLIKFVFTNQLELEKVKVSEKTGVQTSRGVSGQANTSKLMTENEKLRKNLKKVLTCVLLMADSKLFCCCHIEPK